MSYKHEHDDFPNEEEAPSHESRRRANQQLREVVGTLDEITMDEFDYEVEFDTFEPIKQRRGRR